MLFGDVKKQKVPRIGVVFGSENGLEQGIARFFGIFGTEASIASYEQEYGQCRKCEHRPYAARVHTEDDDSGSDECGSCREEPAADNRNHARNAEYGAFTAPRTVGERSTHGDHERDERGGQRQFERGS